VSVAVASRYRAIFSAAVDVINVQSTANILVSRRPDNLIVSQRTTQLVWIGSRVACH